MNPYLLVYLGVAWLGGLGLSRSVSQPIWAWLALAVLGFIAYIAARADRRLRIVCLCLCAVGLGAARYRAAQPAPGDPNTLAFYNDHGPVTIEGLVIAPPDVRDGYTLLRLRTETLRPHGDQQSLAHRVQGLALVEAPLFPAYQYGDRLRVSGSLETPPVFEDFSYRDYLARQGVRSLLRFGAAARLAERQCGRFVSADCNPLLQAVFAFKAQALRLVRLLFPEPQAALLSGILLGVDSNIPAGLQEAFRVTGMSHIVAISGFNLSLVAGAILSVSRFVGQSARRRAALALGGIVFYTLLVGAEASVVRAALMASLAVAARLLGRQSYGPVALAGAAIVMTALNPLTLWDVGFQLSFMATLGLIIYSERVTAWLLRGLGRFTSLAGEKPVARFVGDYLGLTLAAQLTTLPLIVYYFQRLSFISLVANPIVLPAQPAVMALGGLSILTGVIWQPLGQLLAWLVWPFVTYTIAAVEWLARVPGASLDLGRASPAFLVMSYAALFGVTWWATGSPEERPSWVVRAREWWGERSRGSTVLLGALGLGAALTWSAVLSLPDGRLHVTVLSVGQGEAVLVETPSGEQVLIGGGPSGLRLSEGLGRFMPFGQRRLALVVVPGPQDGQVAGLASELPRYAVDQVLVAGPSGRSTVYRELMGGLNLRSVPILAAEAGQEFDLGDGARLKVLAVGEAGLLVRVAWGSASFLLPLGDNEAALRALAASTDNSASTVLLMPAAGPAWDRSLIEAINPQVVVISVGDEGSPPETTAALAGYTVLRTDRNGWVSFATDGDKLWTETERVARPPETAVR